MVYVPVKGKKSGICIIYLCGKATLPIKNIVTQQFNH